MFEFQMYLSTTLDHMPRPRFDALRRGFNHWNPDGREIRQKDSNQLQDMYTCAVLKKLGVCFEGLCGVDFHGGVL